MTNIVIDFTNVFNSLHVLKNIETKKKRKEEKINECNNFRTEEHKVLH